MVGGEMRDVFDTSFLGKEPMRSCFSTLDHDTSHRGAKNDRFKFVVLQLQEEAWAKRVQRWLDLAFPLDLRDKKKKLAPKLVDDDDAAWLLFVKFQWALRKNRRQAVNFLSEARRNRDYNSSCALASGRYSSPTLDISRRKHHTGSRSDTAPKAVRRTRKHPCNRKNRTRTKANARGPSKPLDSMVVDHHKNAEECTPEIIPDDDFATEDFGEAHVLSKTSPEEQSRVPMIIDSPSCPSNCEQLSSFTNGTWPPPQLGETTHNHWSRPDDISGTVPLDITAGVSNTSSSFDSFTCTAVSNTVVPVFPTTSDNIPIRNIGLDTNTTAPLDSFTIKNEREDSPTYLGRSSPVVYYFEGRPATPKMVNGTSSGLLYLPNDPMILYHDGEGNGADFAAGRGGSQYFQVTDRPKEPLRCYPPMWAQSRQEICESFGWFRSYQGGVYYTREIVKGYLLGGFSASRDRFEHGGRLIISHGGGKAASTHQQKGQSFRTSEADQLAQDKSVRALLRTYKECRPIVLVIDERYGLFPFDLSAKGVSYAVLGFYTIAYAWAEYQPAQNEKGHVVRYKFAFRWCGGQGEPWWIQGNSPCMATLPKPVVPPRRSPVKLMEQPLTHVKPSDTSHIHSHCLRCDEKSPKVYVQGWACLIPKCPSFWTTKDHQRLPDRLDYDPKFLELTKPFVLNEMLAKSLKLSMPTSAPDNKVMCSYASTKGWHCNQCGRLSCRDKWEKYECPNCGSSVNVLGKPWSSAALRNLHVSVPFQDHYYSKTSGVTFVGVRYFHDGANHVDASCRTFALPYQRGFIHHIKAVLSDEQPDADVIFREYQDQALAGVLPFRRWPLRSHKCRGSLLTNYFSQNTGAPYQYVGGTANTIAWDKAPDAVINARKMIESRVSKALRRPVQFNEVLSAAYMERQRMAFHSDSEPGLGPLVAGLSLGSPALMHFRLLAKYEPFGEQRHIAMTFVLRHGDILVMDGAQVQVYYEHTVIPSNFRIAATARLISKDHPSS